MAADDSLPATCFLTAGYSLLLAAASSCRWLLQKRRSRTGKHHGTEGRKRRLASKLHYLTLPSEPTRNQLQSAAPMPSKQLHSEVLAGDSETAKHHGPEGRNEYENPTQKLSNVTSKTLETKQKTCKNWLLLLLLLLLLTLETERCLLNRQETSSKVQLPCPQNSSTAKF